MPPVFDMTKKYRAIQSSAQGTLYFQAGHVFAESGKCIGQAPTWGPDLFTEDGKVIDAFDKAMEYVKTHPVVDLPDVQSEVETTHKSPKPEATYTNPFSVDDVFGEDVARGPVKENETFPEITSKRGRPPTKPPGDSSGSGHGPRTL